MKHPWQTWLMFGGCFLVVTAAMGWISNELIQRDRTEARMQHQAAFEENVRLALWRMESVIAPLIAKESSHPYFAYRSFYPTGRAFDQMYAAVAQDEILVPSPLLTTGSDYVTLHFQIDPQLRITSPQVPEREMQRAAESLVAGCMRKDEPTNYELELARLRELLEPEVLIAVCPATTAPQAQVQLWSSLTVSNSLSVQAAGQPTPQMKSTLEQQARQTHAESQVQYLTNVGNQRDVNCLISARDVSEGPTKAIWMGDDLLLARRVMIEGGVYIQGCRLDWPVIREWLLSSIEDLLDHAEIIPVKTGAPGQETRMLAALPVRLEPGAVPALAAATISLSVRNMLIVAWSCVLLAAIAVAVLLRGALSLSERRAAFVSAVTHELRTPLTTFKLYTDLLDDDNGAESPKRRSYVATLKSEANRLGHLVENVLSYARLERNGHPRRRCEQVVVGELLEGITDRLVERTRRAGVTLEVQVASEVREVRIEADAPIVDQILFNLVDNACKYGVGKSQSVVHLDAALNGESVHLHVWDHGPGIDPYVARRLFTPFCKSAHDAANSAPGVGLGLALCRRLARTMGGDLRVESTNSEGACFVVSFKRV